MTQQFYLDGTPKNWKQELGQEHALAFAEVPFSRAKRWEQPQSPPTDEQQTRRGGTRQSYKTKKSYSALRENEDRYG